MRLRRWVGTAAAACVVSAVVAVPAHAANLGDPPSSGGFYAQCNVEIEQQLISGTYKVLWRARCNYGEDSGEPNIIKMTRNGSDWGSSIAINGTGTSCAGGTPPMNGGQFTAQTSVNKLEASQCNDSGLSSPVTGTWELRLDYTGGVTTYRPLESVAVGSTAAFPDYPADWYTGGVSSQDPPDPTGACTRVLQSNGTATFNVGITNSATTGTYSDTWVWDFGDGDTSEVQDSNPTTHVYDTGSMPTDGWTAEATITRTGDGDPYAGTSTTGTCAVRVDFDNPNSDQAGSTGGDGQSTVEQFADCAPSGWALLNPLAYVSGMACVLQLLFIPQHFGESFGDVADAWNGSVIGTVADAFALVWGLPGELQDGYENSTFTDPDACEGPTVNVNWGNLGTESGNVTQEVNPLYACDGPAESAANVIKPLASGLLYIGLAILVVKLALSVLGPVQSMGGDT